MPTQPDVMSVVEALQDAAKRHATDEIMAMFADDAEFELVGLTGPPIHRVNCLSRTCSFARGERFPTRDSYWPSTSSGGLCDCGSQNTSRPTTRACSRERADSFTAATTANARYSSPESTGRAASGSARLTLQHLAMCCNSLHIELSPVYACHLTKSITPILATTSRWQGCACPLVQNHAT